MTIIYTSLQNNHFAKLFMKKLITLLAILALVHPGFAQCSNGYARYGVGASYDRAHDVAADNDGFAYLIGAFGDTAYFGPNALISNGSSDIFLIKYCPSGGVIWAKSFGSVQDDYGYAVATDNNGYLYITGSFNGTMQLDSIALNANYPGTTDIFLAKLTTDGNFIWAKSAGSDGMDNGFDVLAANGAVFVTGNFSSSCLFEGMTAISNGSNDIFLAKYHANGMLQAVNTYGGTLSDAGNGIAVDQSGNIVLIGRFNGTADFITASLTCANSFSDAFTLKLDSALNESWVRQGAMTLEGTGASAAIDNANNIYITGGFSLAASFGTFNLTSNGDKDVFVVKYNSSGTEQWALSGGNTVWDSGSDIVWGPNDKLYVTGYFQNDMTLVGYTVVSSGEEDIFMYEIDAQGNVTDAVVGGGSKSDLGDGIAANQTSIFIGGSFRETALFNGETLTAGVQPDPLIWKVCDGLSSSIRGPSQAVTFRIYPNPAHENLYVEWEGLEDQPVLLEISDLHGRMVESIAIGSRQRIQINTSQFTSGLYLLSLRDKNHSAFFSKFIVD